MDFDRYQYLASLTRAEEADLITAALGLTGESGEFADHIKKWYAQGHEKDHGYMVSELGDILWYVSYAADALGISLAEIAELNIEKLADRYPEGFTTERSLNR